MCIVDMNAWGKCEAAVEKIKRKTEKVHLKNKDETNTILFLGDGESQFWDSLIKKKSNK